MNKKFDITGLGYTAVDYLGFIPHIPGENTKLEMKGMKIQGGGPAATAAVTAGRLGLSASFIGKTGDDAFGKKMREELENEKIDISGMVVEKGKGSQFAFIMVDEKTAARTVIWTRGSLSPMAPGEIDLSIIASSRGLLIDSLEPAAALHAAKYARGKGIPVLIDAGTLREGIREILPFCDHIIGSEYFSDQISGGKGPSEALRKISSFGPVSSVVTAGEKGCIALVDGEIVEIKGFDVKAVDTTGAGDVFHGAYLFAVLQGWDTVRCCIFSNAAAAMKCRALGGRSAIPDLGELLSFIRGSRAEYDFSL
ncbi:MAG: hypothetical protein JW746_07515 [Candidatus Krumholzibacteriota bacterium]|nr:hypothetical protein [Candidatus Krumholzibacteriota bacterium]